MASRDGAPPVHHVSIAAAADRHIDALLAYFVTDTPNRPPNPAAIDNLLRALEHAKALLLSGRGIRHDHPSTYTEMAREGEQWFKMHGYWFGYTVTQDEAVNIAVLDEGADLPRRQ